SLEPVALLGRGSVPRESDGAAGSERAGRCGLGRHQRAALRLARDGRAVAHRTRAVARLRAADQLGRDAARIDGRRRDSGDLQGMSPRPRVRGRMIPALIMCFYAGIIVGWLLHRAFAGPSAGVQVGASELRTAGTSGDVVLSPAGE